MKCNKMQSQSDRKILPQDSRRLSLRSALVKTEELRQKSSNSKYEFAKSNLKCACGKQLLKKGKLKHSRFCQRNLQIISKYPHLNLKIARVVLVDLALSGDPEVRRLIRGCTNSNLTKTQSAEGKYPKRPKLSVIPEIKSRKAENNVACSELTKSYSAKKRNVNLKKSKNTVSNATKKTYGGANSDTKTGTGLDLKKRKAKCMKETVCRQDVAVRNLRGVAKKSHVHICKDCGIQFDSNVGKLSHEFLHTNKVAKVCLGKCDGINFSEACANSDESCDPSINIHVPTVSEEENGVEHDVSLSTNAEVSTEPSEFVSCSKHVPKEPINELELRVSRASIIFGDRTDCEMASKSTNIVQHETMNSDLATTNLSLNPSPISTSKSDKSYSLSSVLAKPEVLQSSNSVNESIKSDCTFMDESDVNSLRETFDPPSVMHDGTSDDNSPESTKDENIYTASCSANTSTDYSNTELLHDNECVDENCDSGAELSINLESSYICDSNIVKGGNGSNAITLGEDCEGYETAETDVCSSGEEQIVTDETNTLDDSDDVLEVEDTSEIVEAAQSSIVKEAYSSSLAQKVFTHENDPTEERAEVVPDVTDSDSSPSKCWDDTSVNFVNERKADQIRKTTLECMEFPLHESHRELNLPHDIINTQKNDELITGRKLQYTYVVQGDKYYDNTCDAPMHASSDCSETHPSKVDLQLPLVSPHSISPLSPKESAVSKNSESCALWAGSRVTSCNRGVLHAATSHPNILESTYDSASGEPPSGLSDTPCFIIKPEESERQEVPDVIAMNVLD